MQDTHDGHIFIGDGKDTEREKQLPRYKCHKEVWALKIAYIERRSERLKPNEEDDGAALIVPADAGYLPFWVDRAYRQKHNPQIGGYYVVYEDGYTSFSPARAFEAGYTRME